MKKTLYNLTKLVLVGADCRFLFKRISDTVGPLSPISTYTIKTIIG